MLKNIIKLYQQIIHLLTDPKIQKARKAGSFLMDCK